MKTTDGELIQGFAPTKIENGVTTLDTSSIEAICIYDDAEYYINDESTKKATIRGGRITLIDHRVKSVTFTVAQTVEIMRVQ